MRFFLQAAPAKKKKDASDLDSDPEEFVPKKKAAVKKPAAAAKPKAAPAKKKKASFDSDSDAE